MRLFTVIFALFAGVALACGYILNANGSTSTSSSTQPANFDKWTLWTNGTQLRGADLYQRRTYPELEGNFLGDGPVGPPVTQADIDALAALGANYVNLSHPGLFTEDPPYQLDPGVQANLDALLDMVAQADMFAVLSFRTGPGRSEFTFFFGGNWFPASYYNDAVWGSQAAQDAWTDMWQYTANRYKENPIVAGYDLMVEPNSNVVGDDATNPLYLWTPDDFYPTYADTLLDWNQFYPDITYAIRAVDPDTPILIGGMGYSGIDWLPYLQPVTDTRTAYLVHFYEPFSYTHQATNAGLTYPGFYDIDYDGQPDNFNKTWLDNRLAPIDDFVQTYGAPVAINESGVVRFAPNAADYLFDVYDLFEQYGLNYAIWEWQPAWPNTQTFDDFNFTHGPNPNNHTPVANALQDNIVSYWANNTIRPSTGNNEYPYSVYIPLVLASPNGVVAAPR